MPGGSEPRACSSGVTASRSRDVAVTFGKRLGLEAARKDGWPAANRLYIYPDVNKEMR